MPFITGGGGGAGGPTSPGFEIGYDQITAPVTVSSTTEATGTTVITAAAHTFDGAPVIAEFFAPAVSAAAATNGTVIISLFESTTQISRLGAVTNNAVAGVIDVPCCLQLRFTPTAASHTYTVTAFEANGNATITAGALGTGAYSPAYLRFLKV